METGAPLLDFNTLILLLMCGGVACIGGIVLFFGAQILGLLVGALGDLAGIVTGIAGGGPIAWCGCLVGLGVCGVCGFFALLLWSFLASCGTPNAVNFCALFGR